MSPGGIPKRKSPPRRLLHSTGCAWMVLALFSAMTLWAISWVAEVSAKPVSVLAPTEIEEAFPNLQFSRMLHLTNAGDGSNRLFVVLQDGQIRVFQNSSTVSTSQLFLDLSSKVSTVNEEEGLLGLAFDPEYETNGYFYVFYSAPAPRRSVLSRFRVSSGNPNLADPGSELIILEVVKTAFEGETFGSHNGGTIVFGPDGLLYVAVGDGGGGNDILGHGQNTSTLSAMVLRIDVSDASPTQTYQIPSDNPFVASAPGAPEVFAYGFRNPWKISFDPATGLLWAGDVGQQTIEEIDIVLKGGNYGWSRMEGTSCFPIGTPSCNQSGLVMPVFQYDHGDGCSVTGGHVYRGTRLPSLIGAYVYGDFCTGKIWALRYNGSTVTEHSLLNNSSLQISSFGLDENQELYILNYKGRIYQFVAPPLPTPTPAPVPGASPWALAALTTLFCLFMALWLKTPTLRYKK